MTRKLASLVLSIVGVPIVFVALPFLAPQSFAGPAGTGPAQPGPGALSGQEVAAVAHAVGFRGQALVIVVAIAGAESKWVPTAQGDMYPIQGCECHSHGLWQIRSCPHADPLVTYDTSGCHPPLDRGWREALLDPNDNASGAYRLAMSPGGWNNWSTFKDDAYLAWMDQAQVVAAPYAGGG